MHDEEKVIALLYGDIPCRVPTISQYRYPYFPFAISSTYSNNLNFLEYIASDHLYIYNFRCLDQSWQLKQLILLLRSRIMVNFTLKPVHNV